MTTKQSNMELRDYQQMAETKAKKLLKKGKRVLLVSPTGSGKTEMGIEVARGYRQVWCTHTVELKQQTSRRLREQFGIVGEISTYVPPNQSATAYVGTVHTLIGKKGIPEPEIVVVDEAHHYVAEDWGLIRHKWPNALLLGLTATPERRDGKAMGDAFDELVVAASIDDLTPQYLSPIALYAPEDALGRDLAIDPVDALLKYGRGRRAFVFCNRVHQCHAWAKEAKRHGIRSAVIEAEMKPLARQAAFRNFETGRVDALFSVTTMTEGVDIPAADCAVLARTFSHPGLLIQCVGRVLRKSHGKDFGLVLDLTGTTRVHGIPTDRTEYSLEGRPIQIRGGREPHEMPEWEDPEVAGVPLIPVNGAKPLEEKEVQEPQQSTRWGELMTAVKRKEITRRIAMDTFRAEFGYWPEERVA